MITRNESSAGNLARPWQSTRRNFVIMQIIFKLLLITLICLKRAIGKLPTWKGVRREENFHINVFSTTRFPLRLLSCSNSAKLEWKLRSNHENLCGAFEKERKIINRGIITWSEALNDVLWHSYQTVSLEATRYTFCLLIKLNILSDMSSHLFSALSSWW